MGTGSQSAQQSHGFGTAGEAFTKRPLGALITGRAWESGSLARTDSSLLNMVSSVRNTWEFYLLQKLRT